MRGSFRQEVFGSAEQDRYRLQQQIRDLGQFVQRQAREEQRDSTEVTTAEPAWEPDTNPDLTPFGPYGPPVGAPSRGPQPATPGGVHRRAHKLIQ